MRKPKKRHKRRHMRRFILVAALALAATAAAPAAPATAGESGFNPGTVVGNVYESPACAGICGFGYAPPVYDYARLAPAHRHPRKKAAVVHD
jgi:hypothetical protein